MTSSEVPLWTLTATITMVIMLVNAIPVACSSCFSAIYSFGDSLADTGNLLLSGSSVAKATIGRFPYGETFFGTPTGRCSDGRLVVDFIAEASGLPPVEPFLKSSSAFVSGVNFAVAGATALNASVLSSVGVQPLTNVSLSAQIDWFLRYKKSFCANFSGDCISDHFARALFIMGEIGGNDYDLQLLSGDRNKSVESVEKFIVPVVDQIDSALTVLIEEGGATKLMVQNNVPVGCFPYYLATHKKAPRDRLGCIPRFNRFVHKGNAVLKARIERIRARYADVSLVYADLYGAVMEVLSSPYKYGLAKTLKACCGKSGSDYNYDAQQLCGVSDDSSWACEQPVKHLHWDGIHLTDSAHRSISSMFVRSENSLAFPPFALALCPRAFPFS